jgi:two-component system, LytTR family, sensor kinase
VSDARLRIGWKLVVGVALGWTLAGVLLGAQTALGSNITGGEVVPVARAVPNALVQTLPWIPITLAVIWLTRRFPLTRDRWRRHALVHLLALSVLSFTANVLVVLGYWLRMGAFRGVGALVRQGLLWGTVNLHVTLMVVLAVTGATSWVLHYREARGRELQLAQLEGQLARAQVQALNAQIRPHFLFNTLHSIGQMWRSGRADEADAVLDRLGALFHRVQRSTSRFEVPLAEELELVREYLAIEQARFRDRLRVAVCAADDALDCAVPPLILQPIVENAIRHGVAAVSTAGQVEVRAEVVGERLRLSVRDDGPGVDAPSAQRGSGTGLRNTRERLAQIYNGSAEVRISSHASHGTTVTIELPRRATAVAMSEAADD